MNKNIICECDNDLFLFFEIGIFRCNKCFAEYQIFYDIIDNKIKQYLLIRKREGGIYSDWEFFEKSKYNPFGISKETPQLKKIIEEDFERQQKKLTDNSDGMTEEEKILWIKKAEIIGLKLLEQSTELVKLFKELDEAEADKIIKDYIKDSPSWEKINEEMTDEEAKLWIEDAEKIRI
jgi:hypothetical protein